MIKNHPQEICSKKSNDTIMIKKWKQQRMKTLFLVTILINIVFLQDFINAQETEEDDDGIDFSEITLAPTQAPPPPLILGNATEVEEKENATIATSTSPPIDYSNESSIPPWGGCVDPNNGSEKHNLIEIGKRTTICIIISKSGNWAEGMNYTRITFQPTADEYSSFLLPHGFWDLTTVVDEEKKQVDYKPYVSVHVAVQHGLSFVKRWFNSFEFKIYPYLTAIIDVDHGKVVGILWDDACMFCNSTRCEENTYKFMGNMTTEVPASKACYIPQLECMSETLEDIAEKGTQSRSKNILDECNFRVYFVWTGTDKNGYPFMSYGSRFGAFPPNFIPTFQMPSISSGLLDWLDEQKDLINQTLNSRFL